MRYIGSKAKILDFISNTVSQTYGSVDGAVVADLFAGTCCVAEMFKKQNARIISNDYLRFSYALQIAKIKCNKEPQSRSLIAKLFLLLTLSMELMDSFSRNTHWKGLLHRNIAETILIAKTQKKLMLFAHSFPLGCGMKLFQRICFSCSQQIWLMP